MIVLRNHASRFVLGASIVMAMASTGGWAGDLAGSGVNRATPDRCGRFGPGFVDIGHGVCGRTSGHLRVYVGTRSALNTPFARSLGGSLSGGTLAGGPLSGRTIPGGSVTVGGAVSGSLNAWPAGGTSTAALRSDGMLAGATVTHLRVRGSLDSFSPFH